MCVLSTSHFGDAQMVTMQQGLNTACFSSPPETLTSWMWFTSYICFPFFKREFSQPPFLGHRPKLLWPITLPNVPPTSSPQTHKQPSFPPAPISPALTGGEFPGGITNMAATHSPGLRLLIPSTLIAMAWVVKGWSRTSCKELGLLVHGG